MEIYLVTWDIVDEWWLVISWGILQTNIWEIIIGNHNP